MVDKNFSGQQARGTAVAEHVTKNVSLGMGAGALYGISTKPSTSSGPNPTGSAGKVFLVVSRKQVPVLMYISRVVVESVYI